MICIWVQIVVICGYVFFLNNGFDVFLNMVVYNFVTVFPDQPGEGC